LTEAVCAAAIRAAGGKPVLVDPKGSDWKKYKGCTLIKPNFGEAKAFLAAHDSAVLAISSGANDKECEALAQQLRDGLHVASVMITRGSHGVSLAEDGLTRSFAGRTVTVRDEAGAGDAVAAAACLALASGASAAE